MAQEYGTGDSVVDGMVSSLRIDGADLHCGPWPVRAGGHALRPRSSGDGARGEHALPQAQKANITCPTSIKPIAK